MRFLKLLRLPFLFTVLILGDAFAQQINVKQILLQERSGLEFFRDGMQFGTGARAISMGGAYSAVGDDYAASFWNPAALAQIRRFELTGGLSHLSGNNNASFSNYSTKDVMTATGISEFGFAYPVPTYRGSMVFSFGYNRIKTFDSNFAFDLQFPKTDVFFVTHPDSINQSWNINENGYLNNWTIAGAIDISPNLSAGVGINFWSGKDTYDNTFKEDDFVFNIWNFSDYRENKRIESELSGFNTTFGTLYRLNNVIRLSATMSTPTTFTVKQVWSSWGRETYDLDLDPPIPDQTFGDDDDDGEPDEFSDEYKIRSPFTFSAGGSMNLIGLILVSGQIEYTDWTQLSYRSDVPLEIEISEDDFRKITQAEANEIIEENFQATQRIRLGAELTLPGTATQLRAGYFYDPSFLKNDTENDREYFSVGLGLLLDKQIKLDLAYVYGTRTEQNEGLNFLVTERSEEITVNKIFGTLSIRF